MADKNTVASGSSRTSIGELADTGRYHLRFGWWSLLVFATLGLILESLHGFKIRIYLDVSNETRRLMWTLAHAHGTLLSLVHIAFGFTALTLPDARARPARAREQRLASKSLVAASFLLPGGFFLGGITIYSGDPGLGILLVPVGAVLLLFAILVTARRITSRLHSPNYLSPRGRGARSANEG